MNKDWTTVISSKSKWYKINFKEIFDYRDLIFIFVKRDIISIYKQTLFGPLWFLFGPLFTVFTYTFLFTEIAHLSTDGLPGPLFYLGGTILWNYFQSCFNSASSTFTANSGIFGKVYFPRLITPISLIISNLLKFSLQFITFLCFLVFYKLTTNSISINFHLLGFNLIVILNLASIAMGSGLIVSSLTSKYRDFNMVVNVFITLLMYSTPIMYPFSSIPVLYKPYLFLNPITPMIEFFRYSFTGKGVIDITAIFYSFCFGFTVLIVGIYLFSKTEKNFMDSV